MTISLNIRLRSCTYTPIDEVPRVGRRLVPRAKGGAKNKSQQSPRSTSLGDSNLRPSSDTRSQDQALTTAPKAIADGEGATLFLNQYAARAPDRMMISPNIRLRSCTYTPIDEVPRVGRLVPEAVIPPSKGWC
ncbi:hypothetical protein GQ457_16G016340 [Hibiscus cannabinus]